MHQTLCDPITESQDQAAEFARDSEVRASVDDLIEKAKSFTERFERTHGEGEDFARYRFD